MAEIQTQVAAGTIVGYFENKEDAASAVEALQDAGFTSAHIGVAGRSGSTASTQGYAASTSSSTGTGAPGAWDKIKNFFSGDDSGSPVEPYADERTQGSLANREVTANPSDSSVAGGYDSEYESYAADDFHPTLSGLSVDEDRSRYFGHRLSGGERSAIVTVNAGGRAAEAEAILARYGADLGEGAAGYDYSATPGRETSQDNIQLLGEVLRVHKDRVSRGEVRIRKEVVTETQTVQVPVTREELVIERRPVVGQMASGSIGDSEEIRIPLSEERASIDKSTVVREEVSVSKKPVEEVRDLSGQIRHEELVVDDQTKQAM